MIRWRGLAVSRFVIATSGPLCSIRSALSCSHTFVRLASAGVIVVSDGDFSNRCRNARGDPRRSYSGSARAMQAVG
jgi:hypothetical protein